MGQRKEIEKFGRALAVAELDQALVSGRLNASQVVELGRVVGREMPREGRRAP